MSAQSTLSVESLDDGGGSDTFDENHQPDFRAKRGSFAKIKNKVLHYETMMPKLPIIIATTSHLLIAKCTFR